MLLDHSASFAAKLSEFTSRSMLSIVFLEHLFLTAKERAFDRSVAANFQVLFKV